MGLHFCSWPLGTCSRASAMSASEGEADIAYASGYGRFYDGVDAPPTASMCQSGGVEHHFKGGVRVRG